jgi:hypothetical protein
MQKNKELRDVTQKKKDDDGLLQPTKTRLDSNSLRNPPPRLGFLRPQLR